MFRQDKINHQTQWDEDDDVIIPDEPVSEPDVLLSEESVINDTVDDSPTDEFIPDELAKDELAPPDLATEEPLPDEFTTDESIPDDGDSDESLLEEMNVKIKPSALDLSQEQDANINEAKLRIEEEQRRYAEEEGYLKKRKAELYRLEELAEAEREEQFEKHKKLTIKAQDKDFAWIENALSQLKPLEEPSLLFSDSTKQGLPRSSWEVGGDSLFDVILTKSNLSPEEQYDLLLFLLTKLNYSLYYEELLHSPLIDCLLENDCFKLLLAELYFLSLKEKQFEYDLEIEKKIWTKLLEENIGCEIFDNIFNSVTTSYKKLFEYIKVWMNNLELPEDILSKCKYIDAAFQGKHLPAYMPFVYKLGKLRLFDIVIEQLRQNQDRFGECHTSAINEMLNLAKNLFITHRNPLLFGGFGHTKSSNIYDLLNSDLDVARQHHEREKENFIKLLDEKIKRDESPSLLHSLRF